MCTVAKNVVKVKQVGRRTWDTRTRKTKNFGHQSMPVNMIVKDQERPNPDRNCNWKNRKSTRIATFPFRIDYISVKDFFIIS